MKFFKKVFNRTSLIIFVLVLEVAVGIVACFAPLIIPQIFVHWSINLIYLLYICILLIVQFVAFFVIIYRNMDAEFKIPWIVILMFLPFVGGLLYLIFKPKGMKRRVNTLISTSVGESTKFLYRTMDTDNFGMATKTIKYVESNLDIHPTEGNRVTYYKNGEEFFPAFIEELKKAEKFIFLEFFIMSKGKILKEIYSVLKEKAANGVKVKIIFDDLGCAGELPGKFVKNCRRDGIQAYKFNKLNPLLKTAFNNRDHRKIAVIDHKAAFTGGINLGDEYANITHPFGYWKDTMVKIEGPAINNFIGMFLSSFDVCANKTTNYKKYMQNDFVKYEDKGLVIPISHGPRPYYDERVGEHTLINIIESAKERVDISSPYFIPSEELISSIRRVALSGVEVNLYLPGVPDKNIVFTMAQTFFITLIQAGVKIHIYRPGFNHEKLVMADNKLVFIGTINMDYRSLVHHFECGTILYDVPCIKKIVEDFKEMEHVSSIVPPTFKLSRTKTVLCSVLKIFMSLL